MPSPRYTITIAHGHSAGTGELMIPADERGGQHEPWQTIGGSPVLAEFTAADGTRWAWAMEDGRPHTFRYVPTTGAYLASPYLHDDGTFTL